MAAAFGPPHQCWMGARRTPRPHWPSAFPQHKECHTLASGCSRLLAPRINPAGGIEGQGEPLPFSKRWSTSVRKAERVPMLRKIPGSRPKKSAVRPAYSSPPGKDIRRGAESQRGWHGDWHRDRPQSQHPRALGSQGTQPTDDSAGKGAAGLERAPAPAGLHAGGLQAEGVLGKESRQGASR